MLNCAASIYGDPGAHEASGAKDYRAPLGQLHGLCNFEAETRSCASKTRLSRLCARSEARGGPADCTDDSGDGGRRRSRPPPPPPARAPVSGASKMDAAYVCFLLLGMGALLPWNALITAVDYWELRFPVSGCGRCLGAFSRAQRTVFVRRNLPLQLSDLFSLFAGRRAATPTAC